MIEARQKRQRKSSTSWTSSIPRKRIKDRNFHFKQFTAEYQNKNVPTLIRLISCFIASKLDWALSYFFDTKKVGDVSKHIKRRLGRFQVSFISLFRKNLFPEDQWENWRNMASYYIFDQKWGWRESEPIKRFDRKRVEKRHSDYWVFMERGFHWRSPGKARKWWSTAEKKSVISNESQISLNRLEISYVLELLERISIRPTEETCDISHYHDKDQQSCKFVE